MPKRNNKPDPYATFRAKSLEDQKTSILSIAELCIDAAPVGLARRIEIYFETLDKHNTTG